jgi:hypothetical protein
MILLCLYLRNPKKFLASVLVVTIKMRKNKTSLTIMKTKSKLEEAQKEEIGEATEATINHVSELIHIFLNQITLLHILILFRLQTVK